MRDTSDSSITVNLADVGTGLAQALPLIVQRHLHSGTDPFLEIVEQPELHLHPTAHGALADLYILAAARGGSFLVETHSENFTLRVRRRIAERKLGLAADQVAIYWIDGEPTTVKRITIDEAGEVDFWPEGVFSEDFKEVQLIRRARAK